MVAYIGGDTSVREKGYLTFNLFRYTHPVYSLLLPVLFLVMGGIGLPGGAVYIETWRLRGRGWESAVSIAGPLANLALAGLLSLLLKFAPVTGDGIWPGIGFLALLQTSAAILNMLPVPPFDGYGILAPFLKPGLRTTIAKYGILIMLGVFAVLWYVPFMNTAFWNVVFWAGKALQLPFDLVLKGYSLFKFWQ